MRENSGIHGFLVPSRVLITTYIICPPAIEAIDHLPEV